ncbi:MAG TPA: CoA transferase, partial [Pseudomonadales bacterium]|nr:CoA transferase [Pseudomonadales bacterium]
IAVVQAIYHRDRTGEGQFVDTSIVNACLLNTSYALARPDGSPFDRARLDQMQYGFSAGQRLYQTLDGWLSVLLLGDAHWNAMYRILGITVGMNAALRGSEAKYADAAARQRNDSELARLFAERFRTDSAAEWFRKLDAAGVPVEICDATFATSMHRDPEFQDRGWIVSFDHPQVGRLEQMGSFANLSDTPLVFRRRPPTVGEHSEEILRELGYCDDEIARMKHESAVGTAADGSLSS